MSRDEFIDEKAPQLAFYAKAFLKDQIDFKEIQHYLWDTLEEWQYHAYKGDAQTDMERVFWHLLHSFDKWPDWVIRGNQFLRGQIDGYCDYLSLGGRCPQHCVGVQP